jgi:hypothetical protein
MLVFLLVRLLEVFFLLLAKRPLEDESTGEGSGSI